MYKKGWSHKRALDQPVEELPLGHPVAAAKKKDVKSLLNTMYGKEWEEDESFAWYRGILKDGIEVEEWEPEEESVCECLEEDSACHV